MMSLHEAAAIMQAFMASLISVDSIPRAGVVVWTVKARQPNVEMVIGFHRPP